MTLAVALLLALTGALLLLSTRPRCTATARLVRRRTRTENRLRRSPGATADWTERAAVSDGTIRTLRHRAYLCDSLEVADFEAHMTRLGCAYHLQRYPVAPLLPTRSDNGF
jgi:hypothetical protein